MASNIRVLAITALLFCVGIGAAVSWLGLPLVKLAYLDGARDEPYVVVDRFTGVDVAQYQQTVTSVLEASSAQYALSSPYQLNHLLEGRREDAVEYLQFVRFSAAGDVVRWLTHGDYAGLDADHPQIMAQQIGFYQRDAEMLLDVLPGVASSNPVTTQTDAWPGAVLLVLTSSGEEAQAMTARQASGAGAILDLLGGIDGLTGSGLAMAGAPIDDLGDQLPFQYAMVFGFDSELNALNLLRGPDAQTARAVSKASVQELTMALYVRQ